MIAIIAILAAMLLPALAAAKRKAQKINCVNNLKEVGIAFRIWEGDNNDKYPMQVSYTAGGASDYCDHGSSTSGTLSASGTPYAPGMVFLVMSNELATAKILFCPSDSIHTAGLGYATNFTYQDLLGIGTPPTGGNKLTTAEGSQALTKISYFIGGDAVESDPQSIMAGDCNIGTASSGAPASSRFAYTTGTSEAGSTSMGPAFSATSPSTVSPNWAWTANDLHQKTGNLLVADGSVQSTTLNSLHVYMQNATNTTQYPAWNFNP